MIGGEDCERGLPRAFVEQFQFDDEHRGDNGDKSCLFDERIITGSEACAVTLFKHRSMLCYQE